VFRVNDWRHRKHAIEFIVNDRVYRCVADDVQVAAEVLVALDICLSQGSVSEKLVGAYLIQGHELLSCIFLIFVQRGEFDIFGWPCFISERRDDSVEIMSPDRDKLPSSTDILMKFILKVDERFI
jgi:hypothetical protein